MEYAYSNCIYYYIKLILSILTIRFIDSFKSMVCNWMNIKYSLLVDEHSITLLQIYHILAVDVQEFDFM